MAFDNQISTVAKHYLVACIWADRPEDDVTYETSEQTEFSAFTECERFILTCGPLFDAALAQFDAGYGKHPDAGSAEAAFGHDFWLTRQGHGAGFWDRDELPEDLRTALTNLVGYGTRFPPVEVEFKNGLVYFCN